jgi:hypothetical protein
MEQYNLSSEREKLIMKNIYPAKLSFNLNGEIIMFQDKGKLI